MITINLRVKCQSTFNGAIETISFISLADWQLLSNRTLLFFFFPKRQKKFYALITVLMHWRHIFANELDNNESGVNDTDYLYDGFYLSDKQQVRKRSLAQRKHATYREEREESPRRIRSSSFPVCDARSRLENAKVQRWIYRRLSTHVSFKAASV